MPRPWPLRLVIALLALAHVPQVSSYYYWLWQEPHYQFFPALMLAVAFLVGQRLRQCGAVEGAPPAVTAALLGFHGVVLAIAFLFGSPWLAASNALLLLVSVVAIAGGPFLLRRLATAMLPLVLLVRPPLSLDQQLMTRLQLMTSHWASVVLDALGTMHCHAGNVIRSGGREYFVEEACSGINSLLAILSAGLVYLIWNRRGVLISTLLLVAAIWWVLVVNVARVVAVVILNSKYDLPIVDGWLHEALGMTLFVGALLLIWSSEQLVTLCLPDAWARTIATPPVAQGATEWVGPGLGWASAAGLVVLPLLVGVGHLLFAVATPADADVAGAIPPLGRSVLAEQVGGWQVAEHQEHTRDRGSINGQFSQEWVLKAGGRSVQLSLDYLFSERHDLAICYRGRGWTVTERGSYPMAPDAPTNTIGELVLSVPAGRHSVVDFVHFDDRLELQNDELITAGERLSKRLFLLNQLLAGLAITAPPTGRRIYQLQVVARGLQPFPPEERARLRDLLTASFRSICARWPTAKDGGR